AGRRTGRPRAGRARQPGARPDRRRNRRDQGRHRRHRRRPERGAVILGRVVGLVWATRKDARVSRSKLLVVEPYGWYDPPAPLGHLVAVDTLDAGVGDDVVVCLGAPARWQLGGVNLPVEAAVMAIVDHCEVVRGAVEWLPGRPPQKVE